MVSNNIIILIKSFDFLKNNHLDKEDSMNYVILKYLVPEYDRVNVFLDFVSLYEGLSEEKGKLYAQIWILGQIIRSLPGLFSAGLYWRISLIKSYFKVVLRNFKRHKSFTIINISGLAIGIAACILIFQYVSFENSYDGFHKNADNIYRVRYDAYSKGKLQYKSAAAVPALGPAMKSDFPEVKDFARLSINWELQRGAITAYTQPYDLEPLLKKFKEQRDLAYKYIKESNVLDTVKPEGAFYMFIKVNGKWKDDKDFVINLMKDKGIVTVPGSGFSPVIKGVYFRIVYLPPVETLKNAMEEIIDFAERRW